MFFPPSGSTRARSFSSAICRRASRRACSGSRLRVRRARWALPIAANFPRLPGAARRSRSACGRRLGAQCARALGLANVEAIPFSGISRSASKERAVRLAPSLRNVLARIGAQSRSAIFSRAGRALLATPVGELCGVVVIRDLVPPAVRREAARARGLDENGALRDRPRTAPLGVCARCDRLPARGRGFSRVRRRSARARRRIWRRSVRPRSEPCCRFRTARALRESRSRGRTTPRKIRATPMGLAFALLQRCRELRPRDFFPFAADSGGRRFGGSLALGRTRACGRARARSPRRRLPRAQRPRP